MRGCGDIGPAVQRLFSREIITDRNPGERLDRFLRPVVEFNVNKTPTWRMNPTMRIPNFAKIRLSESGVRE